ncbi:cell adhesion molecule 4-like [Lytechinus pictus]|uniref:cell adhesion molecule 4-like n=1 Tax=Lytechinus pictus TaxID=7653 RepID=UPI0030BA1417
MLKQYRTCDGKMALQFSLIFCTIIALTNAVIFTSEPEDLMVDQGSRFHLNCAIHGLLANQEVVWRKNNISISIGADVMGDHLIVDLKRYRVVQDITQGSYQLNVFDIARMDDGEYQCVVYNNTGIHLHEVAAQSRTAMVTVYYTPVKKYPYCPFGEASRELNVGENIPACISEKGLPPVMLELQGTFDDLPATHTDYSTVTGFAVLTMNVSEADEGRTYTCRARSSDFQFYTSTCDVGPLRVVYPPRVAIRPIKAVPSVGDEAVFVCEIVANPQPTSIVWSFIPPMDKSRYRLYDENRTLEIVRIREQDDNRILVCTAGNRKGNTSSERVVALSKTHRPRGSDPHAPNERQHNQDHFLFTRCSDANAVIVACLIALAILFLVFVFVVCCRTKSCKCLKSPSKSCTAQKKIQQIDHIDASYTMSNDDTQLIVK